MVACGLKYFWLHCVTVKYFSRLQASEGGDGRNGDCYRHQDRRNIKFGICLRKRYHLNADSFVCDTYLNYFSEMVRCSDHWECSEGLKCVNSWCGDPAYHDSFNKKPCESDHECEERHSGGDMCCLDLSRYGYIGQ